MQTVRFRCLDHRVTVKFKAVNFAARGKGAWPAEQVWTLNTQPATTTRRPRDGFFQTGRMGLVLVELRTNERHTACQSLSNQKGKIIIRRKHYSWLFLLSWNGDDWLERLIPLISVVHFAAFPSSANDHWVVIRDDPFHYCGLFLCWEQLQPCEFEREEASSLWWSIDFRSARGESS